MLASIIQNMLDLFQKDWLETQSILNDDDHHHPLMLIRQIHPHITRGKQLRSLLVLTMGHLFGNCNKTHHQLASIVQSIHGATLLHDDVIDHAQTRHHQPTAWVEHGNKASILVGDYLFSKAFRQIAQLEDPFIIKSLAETTKIIVEGEVEQHQNRGKLNFDETTYFKIIEAKTAELFKQTCALGAYASGAGEKAFHAATKLGLNLGIAFQIKDDLLDYMSTESGKTVGQDWLDDKVTYPVIAIKNSQNQIASVFSQKKSFDQLKNFLADHKAFILTQQKIDEYSNKAFEALNDLPSNSVRKILEDILGSLQYREY